MVFYLQTVLPDGAGGHALEEFKYFNRKNGFKALGNMIRVVYPGSGF